MESLQEDIFSESLQSRVLALFRLRVEQVVALVLLELRIRQRHHKPLWQRELEALLKQVVEVRHEVGVDHLQAGLELSLARTREEESLEL